MSGRPKFSAFRPWGQPSLSKTTNGDKLRSLIPSIGDLGEERKTNVKLAWFFSLVALLFLLANYLDRVTDRRDTNVSSNSTALVSLTLSSPEKARDRAGFSVHFRLSNRGNHPIFYPVRAETNVPIGQLVGRTSPSSEWMSLAGTSKQRVLAVQESMDSNLTWIEMPPGGWADGEFVDAGESPGEHAYVIYVKPGQDLNGRRVLSQSYTSSAN